MKEQCFTEFIEVQTKDLEPSESFVAIKERKDGYFLCVGTPENYNTWAITKEELFMLHEKLGEFIANTNTTGVV